jgi:hypothetical protein
MSHDTSTMSPNKVLWDLNTTSPFAMDKFPQSWKKTDIKIMQIVVRGQFKALAISIWTKCHYQHNKVIKLLFNLYYCLLLSDVLRRIIMSLHENAIQLAYQS